MNHTAGEPAGIAGPAEPDDHTDPEEQIARVISARALSRLDELDQLEVAEHVAVYDDIHSTLESALNPPSIADR